jgi:hypothetical protein
MVKTRFKRGDHVSWNSEAGRVRGRIIRVITGRIMFKGYTVHASEDDPQAGRIFCHGSLPREDLRLVPKGLEFQRVPTRVPEEHRRLLARLPDKSHAGLDDELDAGRPQPLGESTPFFHWQDDPEMRYRHFVAVNRVHHPITARPGLQVGNDLMAIEVEVDPGLGAPALWAAEQASVEGAGRREIVNREGEVEGGRGHRAKLPRHSAFEKSRFDHCGVPGFSLSIHV